MIQRSTDHLVIQLKDLIQMCQHPKFYISTYFSDLKTEVDKEVHHKQMRKQNQEQTNKLHQLWLQNIDIIESFERELIKQRFNLKSNLERLNSIELMLNNESNKNLNEIKESIKKEERNILKILFQNKTIAFINMTQFNETENELIDFKLIKLNDEFISLEAFKRKNYNDGHLTNELVKIFELEQRLKNYSEHIFVDELSLSHITQLDLMNKDLIELEENVFEGFNNLEGLDLSHNEINQINEFAFIDALSRLAFLDLSHNKISSLRTKLFVNLKNLESLNLNYNEIVEIVMENFEGLNNLKVLYLRFNDIQVIEENTFEHLTNLEELDLSYNQIEKINENSFRNLIRLKSLSFDANKISEINCFNGLKRLEVISLSINLLSEINETTFFDLDGLKTLNLGYNQIRRIDEEIFKGLKNLNLLVLKDNLIAEVDENEMLAKLKINYLPNLDNLIDEVDENDDLSQKIEKIDLNQNELINEVIEEEIASIKLVHSTSILNVKKAKKRKKIRINLDEIFIRMIYKIYTKFMK